MLTVLHLSVILGCIVCAALLFRQPEKLNERSKTLASLILMAVAFIAAAEVGQLTLTNSSQDAQTMQRLLSNLATYISTPLMASLLFAASFGYHFSRRGWGRWVLALFAMFELMRRMELGVSYSVVLGALTVTALAIAFVRFNNPTVRTAGLITAGCWGVSMLVAGPYPVWQGLQSEPLRLASFAVGLIAFGIATGQVIRLQQAETKKEAD